MDDDRLTRLLRDLPRATAGPDFNAKVLARLHERPRGAPALGWAVAASACAVAALTFFGAWHAAQQRADARERSRALLAELRAEQRALTAELARYREFEGPPPNQVYVGGDEHLDVVLDVARPVRTPIEALP